MSELIKVGTRVRIVGDHPHKGKTGTVSSTEPPSMSSVIPSLRGMIRVSLDDDTDGCYAEWAELRRLPKSEDPLA